MIENTVGSVIEFGKYKWRILDIQDQLALIVTEHIIDQQPYNNRPGEVTWSNCSLRAHLNEVFYEQFSLVEQARIVPVLNKNMDNQWYASTGGGETLDKVFLLSIEEVVCKYFGDSRYNLENKSPKQRYWFQKKDVNNVKRQVAFEGDSWWWWLRSPGRDNKRSVYVHGDGNIGIQGNGTYRYSSKTIHPKTGSNCGGVRPAMWIKMEE